MESESGKIKIRTAHNDFLLQRSGALVEVRGPEGALQSAVDLDEPGRLRLENLEHMMATLLFTPRPESILVLGTAAGSLLHYLRNRLPQARLTAVDIDAVLVERLLQMRLLPEPGAMLEYVYADAAAWLPACERQFDLLLVDIFNGARSPGWLLREEFSVAMRQACSEHGAVAYNLLVPSDHDYAAFCRRLRRLYADMTLSLPVGNHENRIVCALRDARQGGGMQTLLRRAEELSGELGIDFVRLLQLVYNCNPAGVGPL
jgi:spermidine synthase